MSRRLYFLLPDEKAALKATAALRAENVDDANIQAVAQRERYPLKGDIPEAGITETSDITSAAKKGAVIGGTAGLFAGLAAVVFTPLGLIAAGGALAGSTLGGATAGTWLAALVGAGVPNSDLEVFQAQIERGQILMLVDVEDANAASVMNAIRAAHPEADIRTGEAES